MTDHSFDGVSIDAVREYWNRRPCNIRHSPAPLATRAYFDEVEQRKYRVEGHIPGFAEFPKWSGKRVLEIGCGIGTDTINFARAGALVSAVELSEESLKLARQRAQIFGVQDRITFYSGNAEELSRSVPPQSYDLVYSFGVLHHTPHPDRAIAELRPYLNAQSELRLMLYSRVSYKLFWIMREENVWDMGRIDELIARNSEAQTGCPVTYTYTFDGVRSLLRGFEILELRKAHIFTWEVEAYKRYIYRKDPVWAGVSEEELADLEKELGWHTLVRARLAAS